MADPEHADLLNLHFFIEMYLKFVTSKYFIYVLIIRYIFLKSYKELKMNKNFEPHVLDQIYNFLNVRQDSKRANSYEKTLEFFKEIHLGNKEECVVIGQSKIIGNFGRIGQVCLVNAPNFHEKDKFIKWAYSRLNTL